jgi:hypothetical protein
MALTPAEQAKKDAQDIIDKYKGKGKKLGPRQKAALEAAKETKANALVSIRAAKAAEGGDLGDLRTERDRLMDARALLQRQLADALKAGSGKTKAEISALRQDVFQAGLRAYAYGDEMRGITGRQMGQGTAYTGPGATIKLDAQGRPALDYRTVGGVEYPEGRVQYNVDPAAYIKRFRPKFQPTQEQIDRAGGPGGWVGGLLQGTEAGYLTPWQQTNFQWMLEDADRGILGDAGGFVKLPKDWRTDWRKEEWGDTFDELTGRWERATDPTVRQAAVEDQLRRYNEGLFNPYTGQDVGGTGPPPWEDVTWPWDEDITTDDDTTTTTNVGGVGGGGHYYARPYSIPRMQTGAGWEGLGAEYQPGTVEGLGLLAGKAHAPYEPLRTGLLNARPSFMGTPKGFTPMNFEGGLEGSTTETTNNTNAAGQTFQIISGSVAGGDAVWGWV